MSTKARLIVLITLIITLCGFTLPSVISPFDSDEYLKLDILMDASNYSHEDLADSIENGIDWTQFKSELLEQLQTTEYEIEIEQFEESWLSKLLDFLF